MTNQTFANRGEGIEESREDTVTETKLGPIGRAAKFVKDRPWKSLAVVGITGGAGFLAYTHLRNGDIDEAIGRVKEAAAFSHNLLG